MRSLRSISAKKKVSLLQILQTKVLTLGFFDIFYEKQTYIAHILVHFWVGYSSCYRFDRRGYHYFHTLYFVLVMYQIASEF